MARRTIPPFRCLLSSARFFFALIFAFLLSTSTTAGENPAQGHSEKLAADLRSAGNNEPVDVIVQFKEEPQEEHFEKVRLKGGKEKARLQSVKGGLFSVPANKLEELAADPDVAYISPDRSVKATLDYASPSVGADMAFRYGWDGRGVGVAVVDSGVADHWDLYEWSGTTSYKPGRSRIAYAESFVAAHRTRSAVSADDAYAHGTHVAGIIAGSGWSNMGLTQVTFRGIAPRSHIINLKALDGNGVGRDSQVIAAIERAIQLKGRFNIRVLNLSLGRPVFESFRLDPLCQAVEAAWEAGIVVVVAAGNEGRNNVAGTLGYGTITSPGNDPYVITVGAMKTMKTPSRWDDEIASYSSKGPTAIDHVVKPDLVAPGNRIISLMYKMYDGKTGLAYSYPGIIVPLSYYDTQYVDAPGYTHMWLSGTSMAAPMVSGAAALMLQKEPKLTPDQVKARLMKTSSKTFPRMSVAEDPTTGETFTSTYDIFTVGAGYLDITAALSNNDIAGGSALSPTAVYDQATGSVHVVTAPGSVWGGGTVWGTSTVWGSSVIVEGTGTVWGTATVRDTGTVWDTATVWGTGTVWGTATVWGTGTVWGTRDTQGFATVWGTATVWGSGTSSAECIFSNTGVLVRGEQ